MIPKFSELSTYKMLDGNKKSLAEILDKEIVITGYRVKDSKYSGSNPYLTLQFYFAEDDSKTRHVVFTGSGVLQSQIEDAAKNLEEKGLDFLFSTTISKVGKCFSMT